MTLTKLTAAGLASLFLISCSTTNPSSSRKAKSKHRFESVDTDKDGRLNFNEYNQTKISKLSADPQAQFSKADADGNGFLSKTELKSSMSALRPQRRPRKQ